MDAVSQLRRAAAGDTGRQKISRLSTALAIAFAALWSCGRFSDAPKPCVYSAHVAGPSLHHLLAGAARELREPDVALRKQLPAPQGTRR
jgi:hypothetical protein